MYKKGFKLALIILMTLTLVSCTKTEDYRKEEIFIRTLLRLSSRTNL